MRVLYLHQHFTTRHGFTGNRSYEFARYLVQQGHVVDMICSGIANEPRLNVPTRRRYFRTTVDGISCIPIAAALANPLKITRQSGYRRMASFLYFAHLAKRVGRELNRPDVVLASHTPLTIGLAGMDLARFFDVPFVFEVRDLWPQALVNLGVLRNRLVIAWMRRMERRIYSAAHHIVALSPGMKEGILSAGVESERVTVITNASDLDLFRPDLDPAPGVKRLNLAGKFAAIYFGGMGIANGLEYVVDAAQILRDRRRDSIVFILHGDGGQRVALEDRVRHQGLANVVFSDPVPDKALVAQLVAACDVCLTIYRATREHTWSPNKMFDALAAGKPVLVNVPGWLRETIESNGCGYGVDPRRPVELADRLEQMADDPDECKRMGRNSRSLAEREFAREKLAKNLETVLLAAIAGHSRSTECPDRCSRKQRTSASD